MNEGPCALRPDGRVRDLLDAAGRRGHAHRLVARVISANSGISDSPNTPMLEEMIRQACDDIGPVDKTMLIEHPHRPLWAAGSAPDAALQPHVGVPDVVEHAQAVAKGASRAG